MRNEKLNPDNLNVCENFINELIKELKIDFRMGIETCSRGVWNGKKFKIEEFTTFFYKSLSVGFELSFVPNSSDTIELWTINVRNRGNGFGTKLMNTLLDVSDRTGIKIKLVPVDYDVDENSPKNYLQKLKNWYWELGFEKSKFPTIDPYYTYCPNENYKMVG
jgi:ribosomal protein S18 acetylase RimI-like enzyme